MNLFCKYQIVIYHTYGDNRITYRGFNSLAEIKCAKPPQNGETFRLETRKYKYIPGFYKTICMTFGKDRGWKNMIMDCLQNEEKMIQTEKKSWNEL